MTIVKALFAFIFTVICLAAVGQSRDSSVFLKWKLKPGEVLTYKTEMKELDTTSPKDFGMSGMMKMMGLNDTGKMAEMSNWMKQMSKELRDLELVTKLTEKRKNIVDIEISAVDHDKDKGELKFGGRNMKDSVKSIMKMLSQMTGGRVVMHGAVYKDGRIESFYLSNEQRNLLSLFFQLPARSIKPGDTWSLDTHLISLSENIQCDTSYRHNKAKLVRVQLINGEHIAEIEYDITEYVDGEEKWPFSSESKKNITKVSYHALAKFSIEQGRWISYEGLMSHSSTGMMAQQSTKRYALIPQ